MSRVVSRPIIFRACLPVLACSILLNPCITGSFAVGDDEKTLNTLAQFYGFSGVELFKVDSRGFNLQAGDFTGDGIVDGADLAAWKEAFAVSDRGDANGDNVTDGSDFLIWQRAFNGGTPAAAAVPEPVSCSVLLTSFAALVAWRRR